MWAMSIMSMTALPSSPRTTPILMQSVDGYSHVYVFLPQRTMKRIMMWHNENDGSLMLNKTWFSEKHKTDYHTMGRIINSRFIFLHHHEPS